ncbi:Spectrin beta chain, brain 2 [Cricetulus griseus]|uniref:Spectrin beta chain, brain 2 n=1 Tax=Cricetulus griseus TaxID=10029 RepID=G3I4L3_CRIGR|nr:Spectrin beta chain, brain 2 [Cricetulus griseus]
MWKHLSHELELRGKRLEEALRAQQFYRDAAEAEAWMGEQELHMMGQEKAKVRARAMAVCVTSSCCPGPCCLMSPFPSPRTS